jgi:hypothetical protein
VPAPVRRGELRVALLALLQGDKDRDATIRELSWLTRKYGEVDVRWMLGVIAADVETSAGAERQVALCL